MRPARVYVDTVNSERRHALIEASRVRICEWRALVKADNDRIGEASVCISEDRRVYMATVRLHMRTVLL